MKNNNPHSYEYATATALDVAFQQVKPVVYHVALFSIAVNLSAFSTIVFCLMSMSTVLTTSSLNTLLSFFVLFIAFNLFASFLSSYSNLILRNAACKFSAALLPTVYDVGIETGKISASQSGFNILTDIEIVRDYFIGPSLLAVLQIPWSIIYIAFSFYVEFWIGFSACVVFGVVVSLVFFSKEKLKVVGLEIHQSQSKQFYFIKNHSREKSDIDNPRDGENLSKTWNSLCADYLSAEMRRYHIAKKRDVFIKFWRYLASFGVGGLVGVLAIYNQVNGSDMLAISIIMGSLVGVGQIFTLQWPGFLRARAAYHRLQSLLQSYGSGEGKAFALPKPDGRLDVKSLAMAAPGGNRFIISQVSFALPAGSAMGVIGPSGAGKSTLVRALVGIWPPTHGTVRLDGAEMQHWDPDQLGLHLGYLPQNVELLSGTIAENIARFGSVDDEAVLEAARLAGVHDVIQGLSQGYNTQVGEGGSALSGGQRQRVGLARALYGSPALIVLDEPNSNLDALGETALAEALKAMKERGTTCIMTTEDVHALKMVDFVLVLKDGTMSAFGPRDTILAPIRLQAPRMPVLIEGTVR